MHVSLVPVIGVVGEQKTKPTQHSVATLRSLGINPALLACRSSEPLQDSVRSKLVRGPPAGRVGGGADGNQPLAAAAGLVWDGSVDYLCCAIVLGMLLLLPPALLPHLLGWLATRASPCPPPAGRLLPRAGGPGADDA